VAGGLDVGAGELLRGDGRVQADLIVRTGGRLAPGLPIGTLQVADLTLEPGATLELDIAGARPGTFDQLLAGGRVMIDGAALQLNVGSFSAPPGTVFTLITNAGSASISGVFVDPFGVPLPQGTQLQVGGLKATVSYVGGTQLNILELRTDARLFFIPVRVGGESYLTLFIPNEPFVIQRPEPAAVPIQQTVTEQRTETETIERVVDVREGPAEQEVRLYFRIYDDANQIELPQEFELDPQLLADLPSLFQKYHFPDGHYRIYLQQVGSEHVRLVMDVHVYEGRMVPENFREAEPRL
jgi:hypothetical protein